MQSSFWSRALTFFFWLCASISLTYWGLKFIPSPPAPASAPVVRPSDGTAPVSAQALAQGLGGGRAAAAPVSEAAPPSGINASRFVLSGLADNPATLSRNSLAVIAVDGKPARAYRVGTAIAEGVFLHSIANGKAMLSSDAKASPTITLELPKTAVAEGAPHPTPQPNLLNANPQANVNAAPEKTR